MKGGFLSPDKNDSGQKGDNKPRRGNNIIPVNIKMIKEVPIGGDLGGVVIDGVPVEQVSVVARLYDIAEHQTRTVLSLDDTTGRIKLILYKRDENAISKLMANLSYRPNMYVRAIVLLRVMDKKDTNERMISYICVNIQEVLDFNQVTNHMLSVLSLIHI
eukprot:TRINITY_DN11383_c0_g1_i2.p2 TRINITY_DN11383_c0_g1~~TRINITY_DN11383_c0_g1_i2.p2  ORF type:complete len:160 (-),score=54.21 TRINITY_DN11383_c0_g1_i2:59-538(-)